MFSKFDETGYTVHVPKYPDLLGNDASFGCSLTYGIGVELFEDWPSLLGLYNAGQPGASNDQIARHAITYINDFAPSAIYVMWTYSSRREWVDDNGFCKRFIPGSKQDAGSDWHNAITMLSNSYNDEYNLTKNQLLLRNFCENKYIKLYELMHNTIDRTQYPFGSDNAHPDKSWHKEVSVEFKHYEQI
jgi:hypothetical protein